MKSEIRDARPPASRSEAVLNICYGLSVAENITHLFLFLRQDSMEGVIDRAEQIPWVPRNASIFIGFSSEGLIARPWHIPARFPPGYKRLDSPSERKKSKMYCYASLDTQFPSQYTYPA